MLSYAPVAFTLNKRTTAEASIFDGPWVKEVLLADGEVVLFVLAGETIKGLAVAAVDA
jgi:hypothetical protein